MTTIIIDEYNQDEYKESLAHQKLRELNTSAKLTESFYDFEYFKSNMIPNYEPTQEEIEKSQLGELLA